MALHNLAGLLEQLPRDAAVLGIDLGRRRIGIALSDAHRGMAGPYAVLRRSKFAANMAEIATIARREKVAALVVGLPLETDGTAGRAAQAARDWAHALAAATGLPVAMADERYSTAEVRERAAKQGVVLREADAHAAAEFLSAALIRAADG
ncbi:MAG: Holliday junction resolvase RuvX [Rhodospirillales bacterium]|nr:Holliday junction resolvase RuvX [Rhodospirillales bacterium]